MNEEESLIRAFVMPVRRSRLIDFLASPKRRRKATSGLDHFTDLDTRWVVRLTGDTSPTTLERELRRRGAGDSCHVVSSNPAIDGQRLPLGEALGKVVGLGSGTLLSCVPGVLAYFEGEGPSDRCILARRAP